MIVVVLVLAGIVGLFVMRGRHKRQTAKTDGLLISREDRTASFARGPRRFRQRGTLALPIVPYVMAPGPFRETAGDPLSRPAGHLVLLVIGGYLVVGLVVIAIRSRQDR